jgi:hypothetical protein
MLVSIEFAVSQSDWKAMSIWRRWQYRLCGFGPDKSRSMMLLTQTPDGLKKLQQMCLMDGKEFDVIKEGNFLELPYMSRRYDSRWDNRGLVQWLQAVGTPRRGSFILKGVASFKRADLKARQVDSMLKGVFEVSLFLTAFILVSPILS